MACPLGLVIRLVYQIIDDLSLVLSMRIGFFLWLLVSLPVSAQSTTYFSDPSDRYKVIARLVGNASVLLDRCENLPSHRAAELRQSRQNAAQAAGMPEYEFNRWYRDGYNETLARWSIAPAHERKEMCAQGQILVGI